MFDKESDLRKFIRDVKPESVREHMGMMDMIEATMFVEMCGGAANQIAHLKGQVEILKDINDTLEYHASEHHEQDHKQLAAMDDMRVLNRQLRDDLLNAQNRNSLVADALKELGTTTTRFQEALEYIRAHSDGEAQEIARKALSPHWPSMKPGEGS
jgi:hypothetical protein